MLEDGAKRLSLIEVEPWEAEDLAARKALAVVARAEQEGQTALEQAKLLEQAKAGLPPAPAVQPKGGLHQLRNETHWREVERVVPAVRRERAQDDGDLSIPAVFLAGSFTRCF